MFKSASVWIAKRRQWCGGNCGRKRRREVAAASDRPQWAVRLGGDFIGDGVRIVGIGLPMQKGPLLPFLQFPCAQNLQSAIFAKLVGCRCQKSSPAEVMPSPSLTVAT